MNVDSALLLSAVDEARFERGRIRKRDRTGGPLTYVEVASQSGLHSSVFSRLKRGQLPGDDSLESLLTWLNRDIEEFETCEDCEAADLAAAEAGTALDDDTDDSETESDPTEQVSAIYGKGRLSESEDEDTKRLLTRVRELLREGAVGVSIAHDLNPEDMPSKDTIDDLLAEEKYEELDELMSSVTIRPRHVAIVDTPAFSDARLSLNEDGTVEGNVVFEGLWTGDMRILPYGSLQWDKTLPIPIIFDINDGDHTGATVGFIDELERIDGVTASLRAPDITEDQVNAVVAAAGTTETFSAQFFNTFTSTKAEPLRVGKPDAFGLRRVWGHAAPNGVCHRSDMGACFQYPGDVDPQHGHFHTGAEVALDDGRKIRVGALTFGGGHIDPKLSRRGVSAKDVGRHREDSNRIFGMVRAWQDTHGLAISGVVMPDVSQDDLLRALSSAPSVELWPAAKGRTLVGIHLVPTPAWPVVASAGGSAEEYQSPEAVEIEDGATIVEEAVEEVADQLADDSATPDEDTDTPDEEQPDNDSDAADEGIIARLDRIEKAIALIVNSLPDDIPEPDES